LHKRQEERGQARLPNPELISVEIVISPCAAFNDLTLNGFQFEAMNGFQCEGMNGFQ
jgi:hypothetical protein